MTANGLLEILDEAECFALLARSEIGRLGLSVGALPAIFPVNYLLAAGDIVFRTGDAVKLRHVDASVVSFETDHFDFDSKTGWSVLVVGMAKEVRDTATLESLSKVWVPWVDGERGHIVGIRPAMVSGRRVTPHPPKMM